MLFRKLRNIVEYAFFAPVNRVAQHISFRSAGKLGDILGTLAYRVLRFRRAITLDNLRHAFPEKGEAELSRIAAGTYRGYARAVVEMLWAGGADEAEAREVAPAPKATKFARGRHVPATQEAPAQAPEPSRQMVASAEADLPRGETYFGAPAAPAAVAPPVPQRQPAAAAPPEPEPVAVAPKPLPPEPEAKPLPQPAPETASQEEPATTVAAPLPPRRPTTLASFEAPLPPARPAELGRLPEVMRVRLRRTWHN